MRELVWNVDYLFWFSEVGDFGFWVFAEILIECKSLIIRIVIS